MQTVTIGKARYTIRDDRVGFLEQALKCTGKHKPVKPKMKDCPSRVYPKTTGVSTAEYVHAYYRINHLGEPTAVDQFFGPMSTHVTVPQGADSMEVEA